MTYNEFIEYINQRLHDELGYDENTAIFCPKEKIAQYIKEAKGDSDRAFSVGDLIVLKKKYGEQYTDLQFLAVEKLYRENAPENYESAFDKILNSGRGFDKDIGSIELDVLRDRFGSDYNLLRDRLILRPLNYDLHRDDLKNSVYKRHGDIALVLYQLVSDTEGKLLTSRIRKEELKQWGKEDQSDDVLKGALENTARLFPACVYDTRIEQEVDLLTAEYSKEDIKIYGVEPIITTFRTTNGAISLFYPGVVEKLMKVMGGAFKAVFMNINDVMIFETFDPLADRFTKIAGQSSIMGEMLSDKCYLCDGNGIHETETDNGVSLF